VSVLSLSKGVIFDTIVHNVEHTLNNRRTDPLPWKLTGMSLICDPSRNKKYMQKLQKMQVKDIYCFCSINEHSMNPLPIHCLLF
jgi:hypothetical protein